MPEDVGHIPFFAGIAGIAYVIAASGTVRPATRAAAVIGGVLLLGIALELFQLGTGTGAAELSDVWFDLIGAVLGTIVAIVLLSFLGRGPIVVIVAGGAVIGLLLAPSDALVKFEYASDAVRLRCLEQDTADSAAYSDLPLAPIIRYRFDEGEGVWVHDSAGDLAVRIGNPEAVSWSSRGALRLSGKAPEMTSELPASTLASAVESSDAVSVEAWVTPEALPQDGPARIVTISEGTQLNEVNIHLGVSGSAISFRVSTDCAYSNWTLSDDVLRPGIRHHVVATYRPGEVAMYLDGNQIMLEDVPPGFLGVWQPDYRLHLGDEAGGGRVFQGSLHGIAIYDGALSESAVQMLFDRESNS